MKSGLVNRGSKMFDSENTVSLDQINQTENIFGYDSGADSTIENTSAGWLLEPDVEETTSTDFSGESDLELDSSSNSENQDLITGNSTDEALVGEVQSEDSLLGDGAMPSDSYAIAETLTLQGVNEEVVVEIDTAGVPHIKAQTDADAFFTQGYMHARDRLLQIETARLESSGTLSAVVGESALEGDKEARTLGYNQLGGTAYQNLTPDTKEIVDAYATGINDYLSNNPQLSPEFAALDYQPELWNPVDVMTISQAEVRGGDGGEQNNFTLSQQGLSEERIEELNVEQEDSPTIIQPEDVNFSSTEPQSEPIAETTQLSTSSTSDGESVFPELTEPEYNSNNWVISGDRTTTGKPFLAYDSHGSFNSPSSSYQTSIESPNFDTVGISRPGNPGMIAGRNSNISWGATTTQVDSEDFYILEETEDASGYIYQGEVQPYEIREETIQVKDSEPVTIQVKETVYGPEVSELYGVEQPVALQLVALQPANGFTEAVVGINQASNWEKFKDSAESLTVPNYNLVYADVEGNIGYIAPGNYPIRQPGHTGDYPVAGTGEFDWQGFIPTEDVPQVYNPESGFIVTANNQITPENYPYEINGEFAPGYRAERITELISSKDKLSFEDMQDIQLDTLSLLYRDLKPVLEKIEPTSEQGMYWRDRLLAWDGELTLDSQEATVFESWYTELTRLAASELEDEYFDNSAFIIKGIQTGDPAFDSPGSEPGAYDDAAQAFEASLNREQFNGSIPAWGDLQKASFEPLNENQSESPLQVPFNGGTETVNVSAYDQETFVTTSGPQYRQVVDLSNPEDSLYINPSGQSSDPNSDNYADQLPLWQQEQYLPMR
jgi:penicillin G amidase